MIDWHSIAINLRRAGVSSKYIMRRTGISDKTLSQYRNCVVQEPRFSRGLALLKLHQRFCPEEHAKEVYGKA